MCKENNYVLGLRRAQLIRSSGYDVVSLSTQVRELSQFMIMEWNVAMRFKSNEKDRSNPYDAQNIER